ncbi:MAG: 16S rRNA (cytosine(967)-C(5))-methyltransferase RsmB [Ruminococcus sp.]|nr:16S rRNA (cytosine(967)-C(5))-methyltransferase RsmB [Candidatus Copronaster equi]
MKSARQISFDILFKIQRDNSYSNLILDNFLNKSDLSEQDKKLISALVYGVTERLITLDYQLQRHLTQPLKKLKPQVLTILRLGAYQILYMERIPDSAAVNESVKLAKKNGASFASGLVNAVLRKIISDGLLLPDENEENYMSIVYSVPEWICKMWSESYGRENAVKILEASFGSVETVLRVNTVKTNSDELIEKLHEENTDAQKSQFVENALVVRNAGAIHKTKAYKDGLFHVQDTASQLCCKALNVRENDRVLDVCAAPGGKTFTLAEIMQNKGELLSCDVYEHRLKLIEQGAKRLGLSNVKTLANDGTRFNENIGFFDKILCDVPCSGLGVIRKKPEIRYKSNEEVDKLQNLQYSILCICSQYLEKNGILVYSTCSLNPSENEKIISRFLAEHKDFESVKVLRDVERYGDDTDYLTLMPHIHNCDGFFISAVRKVI